MIQAGILLGYFPLHDLYQRDGRSKAVFLKPLYLTTVLEPPVPSEAAEKLQQFFMALADTAEEVDFDSDGTSLSFELRTHCLTPWHINIQVIRNYFGEKIALYFQFFSEYTGSLTWMALLESLVQILYSLLQDATAQLAIRIANACLIVLWQSHFLTAWK